MGLPVCTKKTHLNAMLNLFQHNNSCKIAFRDAGGFVTPAWIETVFPGDHVLIAGAQGTQHDSHIKVITLDKKQQLSQLVSTYEFDRIVYFSECLNRYFFVNLTFAPAGVYTGVQRTTGEVLG